MTTMLNLITDVSGIRIGNAHDATAATGLTVAVFDRPATASLAVMGGAPGTRESALLEPETTVAAVDAIVLSGGSAYGLDAAGGVMQALAAQGRGFAIRDVRVPIVPQAILFDLLNGGDKPWARGEGEPPHRALAMAAVAAAGKDFPLGSVGAGYGATTVNLKGGLGSASAVTRTGHTVGALVAVNAVGSATVGDGPHFWAAPYEEGGEFGNCGLPVDFDRQALLPRYKGGPGQNTTIALVATDAVLDKAMAKRLAMVAHDGMGRALRPAHAPLDGDLVFAAATGLKPLPEDDIYAFADLGAVAADCLARAIARGVYEATALPLPGALPAWRDLYRPKRPTA